MEKNILLLLTTLLFSTAIFAQNWYVEGGAGFIEFDDGTDIISPANLYIRGGYQFNRYFNVGLETSVTASSYELSEFPGVDYHVDVVTFYVRGGMPLNENIWVYAQLGRSNTEFTSKSLGLKVNEDDSDTMFGLGAELDLDSDTTYLALNYSSYNNNDGVDITAFNVGVGFRF